MRIATTATGRWVACAGLSAGVTSLAIRSTSRGGWGPTWLAVPALLVEWLGVLASALLVWAVAARRPREAEREVETACVTRDPRPHAAPVDVVVRVDGQGTQSIRATLISAQHISGSVVVVDLRAGRSGRNRIAALAREYGAHYVAAAPEDQNGLTLAATECVSPLVLLLDAGDVASPQILDRLVPLIAAHDVGAVQGSTTVAAGDSPEQLTSGRHERDFERTVLNGRLGARGCAVVTGSGALIRRELLAGIAPRPASASLADAEVTAALFASGWKIVSCGRDPVVALRPPASAAEWESAAASRATAARHLVLGLHGALRINRLRVRQRLALLAWSVRPLSGVRRGCVVTLVLTALLAGQVPYRLTVLEAVLTTVFLVGTSLGLGVATGGALRPGDRCRFSVRTLGAAWRGVVSSDGRCADPRRTLTATHGHYEAAGVFAVSALGIALGMRGLSDRLTHTLHPLPGHAEVSLLVVALWLLAVALHSQRLLPPVGSRRRRAVRLGAPIEGQVSFVAGDAAVVAPVHLGDLTVFGASVIVPGHLGDQVMTRDVLLRFRLADASGTSRHVSIRCSARHARDVGHGGVAVGLEFTALARVAADALVRHCLVAPGLAVLGADAARAPAFASRSRMTNAEPPAQPNAHAPRRGGPRAAALVAVTGVAASVGPFGASGGGPGGMVVACAAITLGAIVAGGWLPRRADAASPSWLTPDLVLARDAQTSAALPAHVQSSSPDFAMR